MQLAFGDLLGLGHSLSAFGYSLALILTWFVLLGIVVNFLVAYIIAQVLIERRENQARIRAYDEAHGRV
jgi:phage shock protein PspC (stress-responsive transcriptional regulator)